MGHERIGFLPKTKQWLNIVNQLSTYNGDIESVKQIADNTLIALQNKFEALAFDESVKKAFTYLITIAFSAKQPNQIEYLRSLGYKIEDDLSVFTLMSIAKKNISTVNGSLEINKIAQDAAMQAIIQFQKKHPFTQPSLFEEVSTNTWSRLGTGSAFCELAKSFFASFTERHMRYYLERIAAGHIGDYSQVDKFIKQLNAHSKIIAEHADSVSGIMQSFAAGWFNKNTTSEFPSDEQIQGFLRHSFEKLREEFRREATGK